MTVRWSGDHWAVTGHAEVLEVAADHATFSSARGTTIHTRVDTPLRSVHISDPPVHTEMRALLHRALGTGWLSALTDRARSHAWPAGTFDAVEVISRPIALATLELFLDEPVPHLVPIIRRFARDDYHAAEAEIWAEIDRRLASPRGFVARLLDEDLEDVARRYLIRLVIQTAYQTSELAMSAAIVHVRAPVRDPLVAADEVLRYSSPVLRFAREATRDLTFHGAAIRRGDRVAMYFPEANRDPRVFASPDTLDFDRTPNPHVAFGAGIHRCLGAALARAQVAAVIEHAPRVTLVETHAFRTHVNAGFDRVLCKK
jgi:cholest-4-en-3-one 26-monooxygenase